MLCDFCGSNDANVHLIKIIDNQVEKVNLCEDCARQISMGSDQDILEGLADILIKLFTHRNKGQSSKSLPEIKESAEGNKKCVNCGIDLSTIKKTGKVGCAHCY